MSFSLPVTLPSTLRVLVDHHYAQWLAAVRQAGLEPDLIRLDASFMAELQVVLAGSDYVAEQLRRDPHMAWWLLEGQSLWRSLAAGEMADLLAAVIADS